MGKWVLSLMKQSMMLMIYIVMFLFICSCPNAQGVTLCPGCGNTTVPYPLSTADGCGLPDYRVHCNAQKQLELPALNGSSYRILSINPDSMRMVIKPSDLMSNSCQTQDMKASGIQLNQSLPFNITSTNTVMYLNCDPVLLRSPLNCTSTSPCHQFIDQVGEAKVCRNTSLCCTFTAGGSSTSYRVRVWSGGCRGYTSVLNFNPALPVNKWNYGVEIMWAAPHEPSCEKQSDCDQNSSCLKDPMNSAISRCLCVKDYVWDPVQGFCAKNVSVCNNPSGCGGGNNRGPLIGGLVTGACVAFIVAVISVVFYRKKKLQMEIQAQLSKQRAEILAVNSGGKPAKLFTRKEMLKATNAFSNDQLLGIGGFGEVYRGTLKDGTTVAVKTAKLGSIKGTEQVLNEVRILSQVNHRNLVKLLGCCVDTEEPLMIYEYIPNGTLYDHLHKGPFLDWKTRLNIACQTAEALAYLHSAAFPPIYHRDVKSTNILLDQNMNAKVSDFGLSRLAEPGLSHISTCAQGTLGYLDPEYYRNYQLTDKSDVYSFGVVLLELVTSQKAIDFSRDSDYVNMAVWVVEKHEEGKVMEVVDPRLTEKASPLVLDTIKSVALMAVGCLQEKRQDRPSMKEVAEEINYIITMEAAGMLPDDNHFASSADNYPLLHN
ncbi:wall-associated receptor kinase-like 20 [Cryptomeria japonica]|uniref:wall-associated receptor kinase-like 20 n=1 Tax=Cryptomeria japonica TaxID=3369 RepID=UPI0027DA42E4|nr:wall-associated receptor kinase-like 20 [Cryptomeria japonica]